MLIVNNMKCIPLHSLSLLYLLWLSPWTIQNGNEEQISSPHLAHPKLPVSLASLSCQDTPYTPQDYVSIALNTITWPYLLSCIYFRSCNNPLSVFLPCWQTWENNPIPLQQSWPNADGIKTMSHPVTYLMDPGGRVRMGDGCWSKAGTGLKAGRSNPAMMWCCDCSSGEYATVPWCPWATVIQSTLIKFPTLSTSLPSQTSTLHTGGKDIIQCMRQQLWAW